MSNPNANRFGPALGFGLGLRPAHYNDILDGAPAIDWFEVLSENYMVPGGQPLHFLDRIRERYPVVLHGVSLSIGSSDPLDMEYLARLKELAARARPAWISDHLCWTGVHGLNMHDLLPMPYTDEAVGHVAARIRTVQDFLERRILIENVSSYVAFRESAMSEWAFIDAIAEEADCGILLDINNIFVSGYNNGFDPIAYVNGVQADRVQQFHLAGHENNGAFIVDTHDHPIADPVWELYKAAVARFGAVSTMIERDDKIPPLPDLVAELDSARRIAQAITQGRTRAA